MTIPSLVTEANPVQANITNSNTITLPIRSAVKAAPLLSNIQAPEPLPGRYPHALFAIPRQTPYQVPPHIASQLASVDETNPYVATELQYSQEHDKNLMIPARKELYMLLVMSTCKRKMGAEEWAEVVDDGYELVDCIAKTENDAPPGDRKRVVVCAGTGTGRQGFGRAGKDNAEGKGTAIDDDSADEYDAWDEDNDQWLGMLTKHRHAFGLSWQKLFCVGG